MRNDVLLRFVGVAIMAAVGLLGCSEDAGEGIGGEGTGISNGAGSGSTVVPKNAPDFPSGQGQAKEGTTAYPQGPYGISKGSIIANYKFVGFGNYVELSKSPTFGTQPIELADFYNPHADDAAYMPADASKDDRLFPAGSPYGTGAKKPKALLIDVASVWCGPCNYEAKSVLPGLHAKYKPLGGEFLLQLADGPTPGEAATQIHLLSWSKKYQTNYPTTIDPTYKLGALFDADAFPANMIVDTRTMKIMEIIAGAPDPTDPGDTFWPTFEKVLGSPQ
jgi:hypothetical protein